ncbi:ABC transporter ATP-binding protein [Chlorobium phaeobacteroides]|uniref:ABC transporter related protein n=1 Tax=Chlorobium phaeobacteroides (strain DSM 266 / SMG 266 / 2430) TaxID=290317 RepID=A1BIV5_CHLPD|nr:ABC transporter ATP-binding protein [Chlorobium phaeobacteroides]ABL66332.1 ABC transporter related protein [Chlorobium phaeobacteroides DSM 266]
MIVVNNIVKRYKTRTGYNTVLDGISFSVEKGEKIGILGRNGAGKSTLIRLLGGIEHPDSGTIERRMNVSWPLAAKGGFQGSLTGADNLRFICRIYGVDYADKMKFVEEFAELGQYMHEPLKTYSAGMRGRLAFALSMAIEFDCYLIDEAMSAGDARFRDKCRYELLEKRGDRSIILVSHEPKQMRQFCTVFYVLLDGKIIRFDDGDKAYGFYKKNFN